jgi:RNA polymerase sigma factor (sigma-70 family)
MTVRVTRTGGSPLAWDALLEGFFSSDVRAAEAAAAVFVRLIRFWLHRVGLRETGLGYEDLVQDVLLELARSRGAIREPRALGGWLRTTTLRKLQDRWRALECRPVLAPLGPREHAGGWLLPDAQVLAKEDRSELRQAIGRLPPLLRDCVQLHLAGRSEAEIACEIQARGHRARGAAVVHVHNVKNWLRKARQELKRMLSETRREA